MQIQNAASSSLVVNKLPDGSRVIVDAGNETMYALNATAGAAWDACSEPSTLPQVAANMERTLNAPVTEEMAELAVLELKGKKLVDAPSVQAQPTRRQIFGTLGAALALPLVVTLTMGEQRAYAKSSWSPAPPPPPPKNPWWWF
jgi:hypothetical protein